MTHCGVLRLTGGIVFAIPAHKTVHPGSQASPLDLNEDGILDVPFYKKLPAKVAGVTYVEVSPLIAGKPNSQLLTGDTSGELTWLNNIPRKWEDKHYYYPIPAADIITNPKLSQNPG